MTDYEKLTIAARGATLLVSVVGLGLVLVQLRNAARAFQSSAESNRLSSLMAVLALEGALANSRKELADAAEKMALLAIKDVGSKFETEPLQFAKLAYEERREQYLNFSDRLCTCIIRGYVDEEQYRQDYRQWIVEIVSKHKDLLGPDTRHRNILVVHDAWSTDKKASRAKL